MNLCDNLSVRDIEDLTEAGVQSEVLDAIDCGAKLFMLLWDVNATIR